MLRGYGWCLLRARRPDRIEALEPDPDRGDLLADEADQRLWAAFRVWMDENESGWIQWHLTEYFNNDHGVLTFHISRNHTATEVWEMLSWIAEHGPGSYGLFFVHDDEDDGVYRRSTGVDRSNVFRVHRLLHGVLTEMDDPFLGQVYPRLER
jgi:hypothetical protein